MNLKQIEHIMTGLGFSPYESRAYAALVMENPLTGYELSGKSEIPRSKIYECLERLSRKRLIFPIGGSPVRYVPVPPDELVKRLSDEFESSLKSLSELLNEDSSQNTLEYIFNISGYHEIMSKASEMIRNATLRIDLAIWDEEMSNLAGALQDASERDTYLRILAYGKGAYPFKNIYRHRPLSENEFAGRWITLVKDSSEVLVGQCDGSGGPVAAWTRNNCLVFVSLKYIDHELIKIGDAGQ